MTPDEMRRIVDLVLAPGSQVYPSKINPDRVVVVDGRTGLDACEPTAAEAFAVLFEEADGGPSPHRLYISAAPAAARSREP